MSSGDQPVAQASSVQLQAFAVFLAQRGCNNSPGLWIDLASAAALRATAKSYRDIVDASVQTNASVSQAMATDLIMQSLAVPPAIRAFAQQKLATGSGWFVEESSNWTGFDLRLTIPFLMHRVFNVRQGEYVSYCSCCRRSLKGLAFEEARPCRGAKRELSTALPRVPRRCEDCAEGAITPYPASCSFCDDSDVAFHLRSRFGGGAMLSACKPCSARRPCFTLSSLSQTRSFHVSGSVIKDPGADGIWEEPEHWGFLTHPCVRTYTQLDSGYVAVKAFYLNSTLAFHAAVEPNEVAGLLHLLHDA